MTLEHAGSNDATVQVNVPVDVYIYDWYGNLLTVLEYPEGMWDTTYQAGSRRRDRIGRVVVKPRRGSPNG